MALTQLSNDQHQLLDGITNKLKNIEGVKAVVLGGSFAMGMATETSDLDIGIYYSEQNPFDIESIKLIAEKIADKEQPVVTAFYEWGPWVNGGAWIKTKYGKVDFLYKNIDQISRTIEKAKEGIWENDFEQQPPYGFSSLIFLAETNNCIPVYDPDNLIKKLKERVIEYPPKLKQSVVQQSLWSADFTIWQAESFAAKDDTYNTVGCLTRAVKNIVMALFAINERYPMGDKRAINILEQSTTKPEDFSQRINKILCCIEGGLTDNVVLLKKLFEEVVGLAEGRYKPYYRL
ncbi:putative nucleotidyltransferase [Chitinophaga terrae (ex Kim and Jung 2007)]|uniref:nucleotidyltransferase domain-containing protein n=1 Tax=Chitinophaga terrae (ex Kim and Jung 2007) TaxID=408074 RepID=UPI00277FE640|nr:nucleotidyltransferase domain-containing protein [Chitinophaga terrae (ex Kim and Jung 2007)]MDQ0108969.1 putative nucleotidyltransferase [Chitinophaga terrae (ex Kim and Jung 2007)]